MKKQKRVEDFCGFIIIRECDFLTWPFSRYRIFSHDMHLIGFRPTRKLAHQVCLDILNAYDS